MQQQALSVESSHSPTVTPARLMAPDEVSISVTDRPGDAQRVRGRWFLCGDVTDRFYDLAKGLGGPMTMRLSAFHSPDHLPYGVITHQVEALQHRFLLPLYEERVAQCLRQAAQEPLAFSLGHDASDEAFIQMPPAMPLAWMRLLEMHRPLTASIAPLAIKEFPKAVAEVCELDLVSTLLDGQEVREVSVSVLLPLQAVTLLARVKSRPH